MEPEGLEEIFPIYYSLIYFRLRRDKRGTSLIARLSRVNYGLQYAGMILCFPLFTSFSFTGTIITPVEYIGTVTTLCIDRRGTPLPSSAVDESMTMLQFILPLSEVVIDFHDTLKSITSGFASFDYQDHGFHPSALVRVSLF